MILNVRTSGVFCLLLGLLVSGTAAGPVAAQTKTRPGYIVSYSKDTLRGSVEVTGWGFSPRKIEFIPASGEPLECFPESISAIFISPDVLFEAHHVPMNLSPYKLDDIMAAKPYWNKEDTLVFLQKRVDGYVRLYSITDKTGKQHFYICKKETGLKELTISRTPTIRTFDSVNHMAIAEIELYKGLLMTLFSDCPEVAKKTGSVDFTVRDLSKIVIDYNTNCHKP
jgi:hypothetical protein